MTPDNGAATDKRETKQCASQPIRHMHAAAQPNRAINDCEEKRGPDERQRSPQYGNQTMK